MTTEHMKEGQENSYRLVNGKDYAERVYRQRKEHLLAMPVGQFKNDLALIMFPHAIMVEKK